MVTYEIYPLHLGTIRRLKETFGYRLEPGKKIDVPIVAYYVKGGGKHILVDCGALPPAEIPERNPYERAEDQTLEHSLNKHGITTNDIDIVIVTHLHWDHCGNVELFPQARILVQTIELENAKNPIPLYGHKDTERLVSDIDYELIRGDQQIADGISVLLIPGHTYGMQGVLVQGELQKYFIASDTIGLFECLDKDPPLISGVYVELRSYYKSLEKIKKQSAFILPGHDIKVFEREVYK